MRSSSSARRIRNVCEIVPTRLLSIINILNTSHSYQSCIEFRSRYKIEPTSSDEIKIISEKKDLCTRGLRLFGIWIGIQHQEEFFSSFCTSFTRIIVTHANRRGIAYPIFDVQGRKRVIVRKRILSAKYHL